MWVGKWSYFRSQWSAIPEWIFNILLAKLEFERYGILAQEDPRSRMWWDKNPLIFCQDTFAAICGVSPFFIGCSAYSGSQSLVYIEYPCSTDFPPSLLGLKFAATGDNSHAPLPALGNLHHKTRLNAFRNYSGQSKCCSCFISRETQKPSKNEGTEAKEGAGI